jgi:hypothetical protein
VVALRGGKIVSNEIYMTYDEGNTLYALIWRKSDDLVWNNTDSTFDTYTDVDIDKYDVVLTQQVDSDYYSVDFPAAITGEGVYRVQVMLQPGVIDADADFGIAQGEISWDGTAEIDIFTIDNSMNILIAAGSKVLNIYPPGE